VPIAIVIGVTACGGNGSGQQSQTAISLPDVESTSSNREACFLYLLPKAPAGPGGAMSQSISFYQELSSNSSGALSRAFQLAATTIAQVAPYYDADQFPPVELMDNLQGATWLIDALCEKVLSGGAPNFDTTTTTDSALSNGASACAYIAEKISFDPWGWDVNDIRADAERYIEYASGDLGMNPFLVVSFNKYIEVYRKATDLTSNIDIRIAFQSIIDLLTNYMESHDVIPYPDFEPEFDFDVSNAVSRTRDLCSSVIALQAPTAVNIVNGYTLEAGADLSGADLSGANLSCSLLYLGEPVLPCAVLSGANLSGANLSGAYLSCLRGYLSEPDLPCADLSGANLSGANLSGAFLDGMNLSHANLSGADLSYANLSHANLIGANLIGANLDHANLWRAQLYYANLDHANLTRADLSGAILIGAKLTNAVLAYAKLPGADLSGADLSGANLSWAELRFAKMPDDTIRP